MYCIDMLMWRKGFGNSNKIINSRVDMSPYLENLTIRDGVKTLNL